MQSVGGQILAGVVSHGDPAGCGKVRQSVEHYELSCLMSRGAGLMCTLKFPTTFVGFMRLFWKMGACLHVVLSFLLTHSKVSRKGHG